MLKVKKIKPMVTALITAMDDMENIGLDKIELQENLLKDYFTEKIMKMLYFFLEVPLLL